MYSIFIREIIFRQMKGMNEMKKRILLSAIIIMSCVALCSCGDKNVLSVKEDVLKMKKDESFTIKVEQTKEEPLQWVSNDEAIAIVSPDGTVTALSSGIATITARGEESYVHVGVIVEGDGEYVDKNGNIIQIFDGESDITEIVVGVKGGGKNDVSVKVGETHQLRAYIDPSDCDDPIVWMSENSAIARVDENGKLQAISKGTTKVSATAPNGIKGEMIVRCK